MLRFREGKLAKQAVCDRGYRGKREQIILPGKALKKGGFKNQLQQLMFSSDFSELYIMQELSVNLYR